MTSVEKYQSMLRVDDRPSAGMVTTPVELANEMIDRLPIDVFESDSTTFCDPCFGNGTFIIELIKRLRKHGHSMNNIESRIYGCEIEEGYYNGVSGRKGKLSKYNFDKLHCGDALEYDFNNMKFDVVIGNPPYQETVTHSNKPHGKTIWPRFVLKSIDLLKQSGYLCIIHPGSWRNPTGNFRDIYNTLLSKCLLYLEIHSIEDGRKVFKAATSYDWYVLKNAAEKNETVIKDVEGVEYKIDLEDEIFIPNGRHEEFSRLISTNEEDNIELIQQSAYHTQRAYISSAKEGEYIHPIAYTTTQSNGLQLVYSKVNDKGHFGIPKVIFSNGGGSIPIIDMNGDYGLSQFAYAIADEPSNLKNIEKALNNPKFLELISFSDSQTGVGKHRYNRRVMSLLKRDFWKEFC
jgi:hypothetical protein